MTEITFRTHHENKVWSPSPIEPLVAEFKKTQIGSYHGSGHAAQAYVIGWPQAIDNLPVEDWKQGCRELQGSRFYFNVRPYGRNFICSFPPYQEDIDVFETLCPSATYSNGLQAYIVFATEKEQLDFLTNKA